MNSNFVVWSSDDLAQIKKESKKKDHKHAYAYAHKINLHWFVRHERSFWRNSSSKHGLKLKERRRDIEHTFDSIKTQIKDAMGDQEDFDL
jgi:hypothetical protein